MYKINKDEKVSLKLTDKQSKDLSSLFGRRVHECFKGTLTTQQSKAIGRSDGSLAERVLGRGLVNDLVLQIQVMLSDCANVVAIPRAALVPVDEESTTEPPKRSPEPKGKGKENQKAKEPETLPPPQTYAAALLKAINQQQAKAKKADKQNRAVMAQVSKEAAAERLAKKEEALRTKYKEGYTPLADRKKAGVKKITPATKPKADTASEKVAKAAHSFVRFSQAQMKGYQAAFLAKTGAERWFSAAERAAYKRLSPAEKKKIRAQNHEARVKKEQDQALARQKARKERAARIVVERAAAVERRGASACLHTSRKGVRCDRPAVTTFAGKASAMGLCGIHTGQKLYPLSKSKFGVPQGKLGTEGGDADSDAE